MHGSNGNDMKNISYKQCMKRQVINAEILNVLTYFRAT